jgi:hypothetical protein
LAKTPAVFLIDYRDGLKAAAFLMTGAVKDFTVALDIEGRADPLSLLMWLEEGRPYVMTRCTAIGTKPGSSTAIFFPSPPAKAVFV